MATSLVPVAKSALVQKIRVIPERMAAREAKLYQEFLPAHLEILETPTSPKLVGLTLTLCIMFTLVIVWSFTASIDIHAIAPGRVQISGRSKVVQPFETSKIQNILVKNGMRVSAGALLIELDPTEANADLESKRNQLADLEAQVVRRKHVIDVLLGQKPSSSFVFPDDIPKDIVARTRSAAISDLDQYTSTKNALLAQVNEKRATQKRLADSIAAREALLKILEERTQMRETLVARSSGTRAAVIDALQQVEQTRTDLAYDRGQLIEAQAAERSAQLRIAQLTNETLSRQYDSLTDAAQKRDSAHQDVVKAALRRDRTSLTAPIAGTVQQLSATTVGQVVTAGQPMLVVVPSDGALEIEAEVQNKDIGFVRVGQEAIVKIDSFPFTRYGSIDAHVTQVSRDAVDDRDASSASDTLSNLRGQGSALTSGTPRTQNLIFPVNVQLDKDYIMVDGKRMPITSGMTASVEIRTGSRRVIDYLLAPVLEVTSTAGHER